MLLLYGLTFVGYVLLLSPILQHLDLLADHWRGSDRAQYLLRNYLVEQKSIGASLVSLQAFAVVLTFAWTILTPDKAIPRALLFRRPCWEPFWFFAPAWSERLAIIEIVLPVLAGVVDRIRHTSVCL